MHLFQIKNMSPYDLNRIGVGYNQRCQKCGLAVDKRTSPYEPVGFVNYCKCKKRKKWNGQLK